MYHAAHSRYRADNRWPTGPGVPLVHISDERVVATASRGDSSDVSSSDVETLDREIDIDTSGSESDISEDVLGEMESDEAPNSLSSSPSSSSAPPLSESDLECSLCYRLLYLPITTSCGPSSLLTPREMPNSKRLFHMCFIYLPTRFVRSLLALILTFGDLHDNFTGHSYCKTCFMVAMQYSSNCPLCRHDLTINKHVRSILIASLRDTQ